MFGTCIGFSLIPHGTLDGHIEEGEHHGIPEHRVLVRWGRLARLPSVWSMARVMYYNSGVVSVLYYSGVVSE